MRVPDFRKVRLDEVPGAFRAVMAVAGLGFWLVEGRERRSLTRRYDLRMGGVSKPVASQRGEIPALMPLVEGRSAEAFTHTP